MMIFQRLLVALSALLVWNVHAVEASPPLTNISDDDEWFDGSMDTKEVDCRGSIEGRKVFVDICNATTNDLVINRTSHDFWYAVKYRDSKGGSRVFEKSCLTEHHMGWIEVLHEKSMVGCDLCYSTDFSFELPKDCVHVESVAIELRMIHIPEIGKCRTASDLQTLFWKNRFRKVVDFGLDTTPKDVSHTKRQSPKSRNEQ